MEKYTKSSERPPAEIKVVKRRTYTFLEEEFENGTKGLTRTNDGFSLLEILGLLEITRSEVIQIFKGTLPEPDFIKRQVVKD